MSRRAFTLIELLVVIGVISIMAAMVMPALEAAREGARTTACLGNMRQIALGVGMYAADFAERFPADYGCYNVVQPGFDKVGPMKGVWDYDAAASGRWTNAANKNSIGKMGHWCNQVYAYVPSDRAFLCNVLIHVWQDMNTYEEDRYDFAPYGILPDYILYTNNAREVVPVNFNNVSGYGTNKFSDIPRYGRPSRMSLIEHEHWGEAPPRIPAYMAGPVSDYSSGGWVAATAPYVHNLSTKGKEIHNAYFSLDKTRWVGEQGFIFGDLHVGLMHYFDVYSSTGNAGDPTVAGPKYCYPFP